MNEKGITIFTPIYNRARKLEQLYQSLLDQTDKEFMWIIVDDGSTDDSSSVIEMIVQERRLDVITYRQENQGKHVAHNIGVNLCNTFLFVCVDSDDTLVPEAVETIKRFFCEKNNELLQSTVAGVIAWKGYTTQEKIGEYPDTLASCSLRELYSQHKMSGDTMLIFKTDVIRKYPFPQFIGENFLRESISYDAIDREYKYLILDKILYIAMYNDDGLSKNASSLELRSPNGAALFRWEEYLKSQSRYGKVRNLISYVFFNRLAGNNRESIKKLKLGFFPLWLASWSGFIHYRKKKITR